MNKEVINLLEQYPSCFVADAQNGANVMDAGIKALYEGIHVVGTALTVDAPAGDELGVLSALENYSKPGDLLVVDGKRNKDLAIAGGIVARTCILKKVKGMVIDGVTRDLEDYKQLKFPVFARGLIPRCAYSNVLGRINVPVSCGGVLVRPADIVVGDADGVVVLPKDEVEKISKRLKEVAQHEKNWVDALDKGRLDEFFDMTRTEPKAPPT